MNIPKTGEVWRSKKGSVREVVSVDEDGYWIQYIRPAPAPYEALIVRGRKWHEWVEREQAVRIQKAWRAD